MRWHPFIAVLVLSCNSCATQQGRISETCKPPVSDLELYPRLAQNPYFAHGVPPPGKQMKIERELCGFRIYVGAGSADSMGADLLIVDADGHITQVVTRP